MLEIEFAREALTASEQQVVSHGFHDDSQSKQAPQYHKQSLKWLATNHSGELVAALTANVLWEWLYVDELWVTPSERGAGWGRVLMEKAEAFSESEGLFGIWLWTQSWQAEGFYQRLGYQVFTKFENFPRGHSRIGFRKYLAN